MKHLFTLLVLSMIFLNTQAQTEVSGNQSGIWSVTESPYLVVGEIVVPSGETLTIEAGVEVNFQAHYKLSVNGTIEALGAINDSVFFTTDYPNVGWGGIRLNGSDNNIFNYCRIEFGKTINDYPDAHGAAVALFGVDASFNHCVFADNYAYADGYGMGGAIYAFSSVNTTFNSCSFLRNHSYGSGGAIEFSGDNGTVLTDCVFIQNYCDYGGGAISCYLVEGTKMTRCLFVENYTNYNNGGAIRISGMGNNVYLENCSISENSANNGDGGAINIDYGTAYMVNCIVYNNPGAYSDDVYLGMAGYAEINYCNSNIPDGATGGNNITENPLFEDIATLNYQLQEFSPCIDAGTDIGYEYWGEAPDMGCFEWEETSAVTALNTLIMEVFPNPTSGQINFNTIEHIQSICVYDISGHMVMEKSNIKIQKSLDLSVLNNGIYFLEIQTSKEIFIAKLIKE